MISLKRKLVLYFLSLGILTIITLSWFSYDHAKTAIMNRTLDQLTSIKIIKKRILENFFNDRLKEIQLISRTNAAGHLWRSVYSELNLNDRFLYRETASLDFPYMLRYLYDCRYYDEILFYQPDQFIVSGKIIHPVQYVWEKKDSQKYGFFRESWNIISGSGNPLITDYIKSPDDSLFGLYIIAPLYQHNRICGLMAARMHGEVIDGMMVENNPRHGLGMSGESYLVGSDHRMRSRSRFDTASVMKTAVHTAPLERAIQGESGSMMAEDYRGVPVLSSYDRINLPFFQWMILVEMDLQEAMIPIITFQKYLWIISVILTMILSALIYGIARNITRPLMQLRTAVEQFRKGGRDQPISVSARDELGLLTEAFNNMMTQIRDQNAFLKERDERLQLLHDATTDGVMLHDRGKPILVNQAISALTGYSAEELMGMHLGDILTVPSSAELSETERFARIYETTASDRDNHVFPVEVQERLLDYNGKNIQAVVIRDISKRIKMEEALREERVKRISSVIDGQEQERGRLSRELHDGLGQNLVAIKLMLESADIENPENIECVLNEVRSMFDATIEEVRRISNDLMPAVLSQFGVVTAIQQLGQTIHQSAGIETSIDIQVNESELDNKLKMYIFRIIQEALHNVVKHAQATAVSVSLISQPERFALCISDNGRGFVRETYPNGSGHGLHNMRIRVNLLKGLFDLQSVPDQGTTITVIIPKQ